MPNALSLLPSNLPSVEHVTAVTVSVKDKLTLSLGVAVGSSIVRIPPLRPPVSLELAFNAALHRDLLAANRSFCHSVHRHPRVDHRQAAEPALRSI